MRILLIAALAGIALSQPKDVDGWGPVHWGMTVDEAAQATGGVVTNKSLQQHRRVVATGDYGEVSVGTLRHAKLINRICVVPEGQNTPQTKDSAYAQLRAELVEQFGHPKITHMYYDLWDFPSTRIELSTVSLFGDPNGPVNVVFTLMRRKK